MASFRRRLGPGPSVGTTGSGSGHCRRRRHRRIFIEQAAYWIGGIGGHDMLCTPLSRTARRCDQIDANEGYSYYDALQVNLNGTSRVNEHLRLEFRIDPNFTGFSRTDGSRPTPGRAFGHS